MKKNDHGYEPKFITDLLHLVRSGAEIYGEKTLYIYNENKEEKKVNYIENYERVLSFGTALCHYELAGKKIAVVGDTHPSYMTAFISTVATNGTIVPLDKDLPEKTLIEFMNIAEVSAVVYTDKFNGKLISFKDALPTVKYFIPIDDNCEEINSDGVIAFSHMLEKGKELLDAGNTAFTDITIDLEALAAIIFTSGTTGTSKGVMLSHRNFVATVNGGIDAMRQFDDTNLFVDCLPMNHSYEITCGQLAIQNLGSTMVINDSIKNVMRNFAKYKPDALMLVPLYVETMHKKIWSEINKKGLTSKVRNAMKISDAMLKVGVDLRPKFFSQIINPLGGRLKHIVVGGAPMSPEIIKDFKSFGVTVIEGYGITECSPLVAVNRFGKAKLHSVGTAINCCEVRIDKENPDDETGEIVVKGENVMMGYYKNPEATAEVFTEDGWFKTGDIGYMDKDEYIYITGRKKNVIILSNGKNVFPEEIEEHLAKKYDIIAESVVLGRANASGEVVITAVIYPNPEFSKDKASEDVEAAVRGAVNEVNKSLPVYKQIRDIEIRDTEFEKTTTRKIKRFLVK